MPVTIILFTKGEDKKYEFNIRLGLNFKHIKFETNNLEELSKIAFFRVINFPTSIIIDDRDKVLLRIKGSIPESYIERYI